MTRTLSEFYQRFNQLRGRRVFIIPTRFGFVYAAFLFLILLGSINYSNSMGHVLCFLLASLGQIAMLHTYRNLAKIELNNAYAEPVFFGQTITFILLFDNHSKFDCYQIEVSSKQHEIRSWNPFKKLTGFKLHRMISLLKKQQNDHYALSLPAQKRGKLALGRIRIASLFPLGLFHTWSYFNTEYTALVYPKPEGDLPLPLTAEYGQQFKQHQQKGVDDFSGFNSYRVGDPIHAIAWKAMARDDILRTKQFTSQQGGLVMLSWQDLNHIADIEIRLSQLCSWVLQADSAGMNYGLTLPSTTLHYGHGEVHRHRCLTALALYEQ